MGFDAIVVGGGLIGRAVAHALAEVGLEVASVYRRGETQGQASAAAGGMLAVFSEVSSHDSPRRRELDVSHRWLARRLYDGWVASLAEASHQPVLTQQGMFVIANAVGDDDSAELAAIRLAAEALGRPAETVAGRDVPGMGSQAVKRVTGAVYLPDEGSVDALQLLGALEVCLAHHPRVTCLDDRAVSLRPGEDIEVTLSSAATIRGREVVLACGVGVGRLLQASSLTDLGVPPIFSGRGVGLTVRSSVRLPQPVRTPNRGFACGLHVVPRAGGHIYIGATNRFSTMPDSEQRAELGEVNNLLDGVIEEINPRFGHAELLDVAVGHRPVTGDRLPLVGRSEDPRILIASGTYRNGVLLAPLVARLIAEEVREPGKHANHPFRPARAAPDCIEGDLASWIEQASRSLLATILEPGGTLPYERRDEVQAVLRTLLSMLLDPQHDGADLQRNVRRLMRLAPIEESVPLLYDMVVRRQRRA